MSDTLKTVKMAVVNPGNEAGDGEFTLSLQPRFNPGRTVVFELIPSDAEAIHRALEAYLKKVRKG